MYSYGWLDKIVNVQENGTMLASFDYHINGQIAAATRNGKTENFFWDGLALIHRDGTNYVNEPYVTGGNPILSDNKVLFNDMLGTTLGSKEGEKFSSIQRDAFGMLSSEQSTKSESSDNFFTGKPFIGELGYSFLFRNYRAEQGKWQTSDPLGYPDGWNNLAYVNNSPFCDIDFLGAWSFARWLYTGNGNASDETYEASVEAAGGFIFDLNPVIQAGVGGTVIGGGGSGASTQVNYSIVQSDFSGTTTLSAGAGYDVSASAFIGLQVFGTMSNGTSVGNNISFSLRGPFGASMSYDPTSGSLSFSLSIGIGAGASVTTNGSITYGVDELGETEYNSFRQSYDPALTSIICASVQQSIIVAYLE